MSRRYSPDHKQLVLRIFAVFFDVDFVATSRFTGIPERTIRDWYYADLEAIKRQYAAAAGTPPAPAASVEKGEKFARSAQRR